MRFVEMTSRIRLRPELANCFWVCWMWNACADAFVLLDVILMRAWAAAAFLDPHALVSVFGVSLVTTTLRHDHKGSRFAFEQAKATPRVEAQGKMIFQSGPSVVSSRSLLVRALTGQTLVVVLL